jgi:hypothetical protein
LARIRPTRDIRSSAHPAAKCCSHELQSAGSPHAVTTFHLFEDEDDDEYEMLRRRSSWLLDSSSWLLPLECCQSNPLNDTGLDPANIQLQGAIRSLEEWVGAIRQGDL